MNIMSCIKADEKGPLPLRGATIHRRINVGASERALVLFGVENGVWCWRELPCRVMKCLWVMYDLELLHLF